MKNNSVLGVALGLVLMTGVFAILFAYPLNAQTGGPGQEAEPVYFDINQRVNDEWTATGTLVLSTPVLTVESPNARARVMTYRIEIRSVKRPGLGPTFYNAPVLLEAGADPVVSSLIAKRKKGAEPKPDDLAYACSVRITPKSNTWAEVMSSSDIQVAIDWQQE